MIGRHTTISTRNAIRRNERTSPVSTTPSFHWIGLIFRSKSTSDLIVNEMSARIDNMEGTIQDLMNDTEPAGPVSGVSAGSGLKK
jgi:hypothetical protein